MQCATYIPVYRARDVNVGSSGFSWYLFSKAHYIEENSCNISSPPYNMEQYLSYGKEVLRQIIQNHDATFRHQVQELHRLYKKQREVMDETRVRKVFPQNLLWQTTSESTHSLSHARSDIFQATSHTTSWLLGDHSHSKLSELTAATFQQPPKFIPSNYFQELTALHNGPVVRKNRYNEYKIVDLELPADAYCGDERNQFTERNLLEAPELTRDSPEKLPSIHPAAGSEIGSFKTRDLSSLNLNNGKRRCFIDLNEPMQIESLPSSSMCPMETYSCHMEIMHNSPCISETLVRKDGSSDGIKSSVSIDLNSMPDCCVSEAEINLEHIRTIEKETTEIQDRCVENLPIVDTEIDNKLLKTETDIDLNTDVVPKEPSPSSSTVQVKSGGDIDLKGPLSPENVECCPPSGKSEGNVQLGQGKREPLMELDVIAARTLAMISSYGAHDCLSWFAEIIATGDDLENKITKPKNDAAYNDQGELSVPDFGAVEFHFSEENATNLFSRVKKENETGDPSVRSQKGHARGTRRLKDSVTEALSKSVGEIEGFLQTVSSRKRTGKKGCPEPRKYSEVSADRVRKTMSSILKQPATRSKHEVLLSWGKIKKREGGLRRKASKLFVISRFCEELVIMNTLVHTKTLSSFQGLQRCSVLVLKKAMD